MAAAEEKTRAQVVYEAIEAFKAENPGVSNVKAFEQMAPSLGGTKGSVSQAYYYHRASIEKASQPRAPRKRTKLNPAGRQRVEVTSENGDGMTLEQAIDNLMDAVRAVKVAAVGRERQMAAREAHVRRIEQVVASVSGR